MGSLPCWVRKTGITGNDVCAVALLSPASMRSREAKRIDQLHQAIFKAWVGVAVLVIVTLCCFKAAADTMAQPTESERSRARHHALVVRALNARLARAQQGYNPPPLPTPTSPRPKIGQRVFVQKSSDEEKREGQVLGDDGGDSVPFKIGFADGTYDYFNRINFVLAE